MNSKIIEVIFNLICLCIIINSCKSDSPLNTNLNKNLIKKSNQENNIFRILNSIDTTITINENILIIPQNACGKCKKLALNMCEKIYNNSKTSIVVIGRYESSDCSCNSKLINIPNGILERYLPIYGVTLLQDSMKSYKINYLNPQNIEQVLTSLIY